MMIFVMVLEGSDKRCLLSNKGTISEKANDIFWYSYIEFLDVLVFLTHRTLTSCRCLYRRCWTSCHCVWSWCGFHQRARWILPLNRCQLYQSNQQPPARSWMTLIEWWTCGTGHGPRALIAEAIWHWVAFQIDTSIIWYVFFWKI